MADARSIEFETEQRQGVGTRFVCDTRVGPLRIDDTLTVTEWDPPHTMGIRHDGAVSGTGVFHLAPADRPGHTELTWTEELRFPWWMGAGVGGPGGGAGAAPHLGGQPGAPQATSRSRAVVAAPDAMTTTNGARRHAAKAATATPGARASSTSC